ncbi:MAG TPA: family 16 glycoside hydrolase, partial [Verrucomicrobiae bacterium]|nr:family 16 glycoside hydrolase [Verrucomicrobiae bacterium]
MKTPLLALLFVLNLHAGEEPGFTSLFNGRDLKGWVNVNCAPETWHATNGVIYCTGHPTGALRTERQYENFILEVEWRHLSSGGNSGIFIWASPVAAPGVPFLRAVEVQVLDHGYNANGKNEWYTTHGDVFPIHGSHMKPFGRHNGERSFPSAERSKGSPEWNHYRIACSNGVIRLSVNGAEVSGGEECNYRKGYIGLESEGAPVEFRNIRVKELAPGNAGPGVTAPADAGFRPIFNGLDLRGWVAADSWSVDGEKIRLNGKVASGKPLRTEKEYRDAEFILDVRPARESSQPPVAEFRGVSIALEGAPPAAFTRFQIGVRSGTLVVMRDGREIRREKLPKSAT